MPSQLFFTVVIEIFLILLTMVLFSQPSVIFGSISKKYSPVITAGGVIFLCITFCWSFLLGSYIALSKMI